MVWHSGRYIVEGRLHTLESKWLNSLTDWRMDTGWKSRRMQHALMMCKAKSSPPFGPNHSVLMLVLRTSMYPIFIFFKQLCRCGFAMLGDHSRPQTFIYGAGRDFIISTAHLFWLHDMCTGWRRSRYCEWKQRPTQILHWVHSVICSAWCALFGDSTCQ